jgi:hypothetical protein
MVIGVPPYGPPISGRLDALCQEFVLSRDFEHLAFDDGTLNIVSSASQLRRFVAIVLAVGHVLFWQRQQRSKRTTKGSV